MANSGKGLANVELLLQASRGVKRTGNGQQEAIRKLSHAIYQSRRRRGRDTIPGIGFIAKYVETAEYLYTIPNFGDVGLNGRVFVNIAHNYEEIGNFRGSADIMHNWSRNIIDLEYFFKVLYE